MGYVYFIRNEHGLVKIGQAQDPRHRLRVLSTASSTKLELVHLIKTNNAARTEANLHEMFIDKRIRLEWFALDAEDIARVKRYKKVEWKHGSVPAVRLTHLKGGWIEYRRCGGHMRYAIERAWVNVDGQLVKVSHNRSDLPRMTEEQYQQWKTGTIPPGASGIVRFMRSLDSSGQKDGEA